MDYTTEYQKNLISMLISDHDAWRLCAPHFKPEYFDDNLHSTIRFINAYHTQYATLPAHEQIAAQPNGARIAKFSEPAQHTQATVDSYEQFMRYRGMENVILDGIDLLRSGRANVFLDDVNDAHNLRIQAQPHPFDGLWINECEQVEAPEFLIPNWLVADSVTCVYGAPGSYKSFFCLSAAFCLAAGVSFAGKPVRQTSVAYVAAEGQRGVALRLEALRAAYEVTPARTSFRLITQPLNLLDDEEVGVFIRYLADLERREDIKFGLVVLDTYSQCIAGADENSQAIASKASSNMIRIRRELATTVVYVHHTGKDATRGMRGSDALRANTDGAVEIIRDDEQQAATAIVRRSKDASTGERLRFAMRFQKVARLAGKEFDGSLVPQFLEEQPVRVTPLPTAGREVGWLEDLWKQMEREPKISVKRALEVTRRHTSGHYKDKLAALLPLDQPVDVIDADGVVLGQLMRSASHRANNAYGDITRTS